MVTGVKTAKVLDACHVIPHAMRVNYSFENGLLLRKDIHKLYDDKLLGIDKSGTIHISLEISKEEHEYYQYNGQKIIGKICSKLSSNLAEKFEDYLECNPT
ncbi:MAG: hypothetical protein ACJA0T_000134 [Colwellia sp.]|jgi:hypothetical protein